MGSGNVRVFNTTYSVQSVCRQVRKEPLMTPTVKEAQSSPTNAFADTVRSNRGRQLKAIGGGELTLPPGAKAASKPKSTSTRKPAAKKTQIKAPAAKKVTAGKPASSLKVVIPDRSLTQRMDALKRANEIRSDRAQLKRNLKSGRTWVVDVLEAPAEWALTMKLYDLIVNVPKYGRVKTNRLLQQCRISPSKTLGGLTDRQRVEVMEILRCMPRPVAVEVDEEPAAKNTSDDAQHMGALGEANRVRLTRAEIKRGLKDGTLSVAELISMPPEAILNMEIEEFLGALPRWGGQRARRLLDPIPVKANKLIRELTERQRMAIAKHFCETNQAFRELQQRVKDTQGGEHLALAA